MKAIAFGGGELKEVDVAVPELRPRDVLVRVSAAGLNPVDTKVVAGKVPPAPKEGTAGYDGVGIVEKVGSEATLFKVGDKVYGAGDITRNGSNADLWAIDERIIAAPPSSLSDGHAASVPLVALTAFEGLFEGLGISEDPTANQGKKLLILPGAGGVGSYVIQLAKLAGLEVIATASRSESQAAVKALGADHAINHREPLAPQLKAIGKDNVDYIYNAFNIEGYIEQYAEIIAPMGHIVSIVESENNINITCLMGKRASFTWELMFTRTLFDVEPEKQGQILKKVAGYIDSGKVKIPDVDVKPWSLANLQELHKQQKSGTTIGKLVMVRE